MTLDFEYSQLSEVLGHIAYGVGMGGMVVSLLIVAAVSVLPEKVFYWLITPAAVITIAALVTSLVCGVQWNSVKDDIKYGLALKGYEIVEPHKDGYIAQKEGVLTFCDRERLNSETIQIRCGK